MPSSLTEWIQLALLLLNALLAFLGRQQSIRNGDQLQRINGPSSSKGSH